MSRESRQQMAEESAAREARLDRFRCAFGAALAAKWATGGLLPEDNPAERERITREADAWIVKRADDLARAMLDHVEKDARWSL